MHLTYWSIAQTKDRETEASGLGWELFKNYLIAKEKWKPDYFLYENNVSADWKIKAQIKHEFGVTDAEQIDMFTEDTGVRYTEINSALLSAQNRARFYVTNFGDIEQPKDRGILLKDILESGFDLTSGEKGFALTTRIAGAQAENTIERHQRNMIAEPIDYSPRDGYAIEISDNGILKRNENCGIADNGSYVSFTDAASNTLTASHTNKVIEPIRVGSMPRPSGELSESQAFRVYDPNGKSVPLQSQAGGGGGKTGLYAISEEYYKGAEDSSLVGMTTDGEGKYRNGSQPSQQYRVFSTEEKSQTLNTMANENYIVKDETMYVNEATVSGKAGIEIGECVDLSQPNSKTRRGRRMVEKANCLTTDNQFYQYIGTKEYPVYEVKDGKITIKGKQYPIRLVDGYYIIRKLTVRECMRLQTVPEWYVFPVSDSQAYKMLGNGWTVEVIKHLLSHIPNIQNEEVEVLSMYDGMACGMIALKEMGVNVVKYTAYEIDKYAIQTATYNFPEIIEKGDAFQVREDGWQP